MPNSTSIRRAILSDAARISELTQSIQALHAAAMPTVFKPASADTFSRAKVKHLLAQDESVFLIADLSGSVAGYLYAEVQHPAETAMKFATSRMLIHHMVVDTRHQRMGIGKQLLAAIRQVAGEEQISSLVLDVWNFNHEARKFYQSVGFCDTRHAMSLSLQESDTPRIVV